MEIFIGKSDDFAEGALRRVTDDDNDLDICVGLVAGVVVAVEDRCPHMAAPLSFETVSGTEVVCPFHRAAFDLLTGEVKQGPNLPPLPSGADPNDPALVRARLFHSVRTKPLNRMTVMQKDDGYYVVI